MTTTIVIKCDHCAADLTKGGSRSEYRLALTAELLPNNIGVEFMVLVNPPINQDHHFCGTGCLEMWLQAKHKGASTPPTPNA